MSGAGSIARRSRPRGGSTLSVCRGGDGDFAAFRSATDLRLVKRQGQTLAAFDASPTRGTRDQNLVNPAQSAMWVVLAHGKPFLRKGE
jgi:hypothetical protein